MEGICWHQFGEFIGGFVTQYAQVCVDFLVRGDVCCDSHHIMVCMSNFSRWWCWEVGWKRWLWIRQMDLRLCVKIYEWVVLSLGEVEVSSR